MSAVSFTADRAPRPLSPHTMRTTKGPPEALPGLGMVRGSACSPGSPQDVEPQPGRGPGN